jgi:hypothetical protein
MDRVEQYRTIVKQLIHEYASFKPSHGQIETEVREIASFIAQPSRQTLFHGA